MCVPMLLTTQGGMVHDGGTVGGIGREVRGEDCFKQTVA